MTSPALPDGVTIEHLLQLRDGLESLADEPSPAEPYWRITSDPTRELPRRRAVAS